MRGVLEVHRDGSGAGRSRAVLAEDGSHSSRAHDQRSPAVRRARSPLASPLPGRPRELQRRRSRAEAPVAELASNDSREMRRPGDRLARRSSETAPRNPVPAEAKHSAVEGRRRCLFALIERAPGSRRAGLCGLRPRNGSYSACCSLSPRPGSRPASRSALRSRNSTWALKLRSSSSAQRRRAS